MTAKLGRRHKLKSDWPEKSVLCPLNFCANRFLLAGTEFAARTGLAVGPTKGTDSARSATTLPRSFVNASDPHHKASPAKVKQPDFLAKAERHPYTKKEGQKLVEHLLACL